MCSSRASNRDSIQPSARDRLTLTHYATESPTQVEMLWCWGCVRTAQAALCYTAAVCHTIVIFDKTLYVSTEEYIDELCAIHKDRDIPIIHGVVDDGDICAVSEAETCAQVRLDASFFAVNTSFSCKIVVSNKWVITSSLFQTLCYEISTLLFLFLYNSAVSLSASLSIHVRFAIYRVIKKVRTGLVFASNFVKS